MLAHKGGGIICLFLRNCERHLALHFLPSEIKTERLEIDVLPSNRDLQAVVPVCPVASLGRILSANIFSKFVLSSHNKSTLGMHSGSESYQSWQYMRVFTQCHRSGQLLRSSTKRATQIALWKTSSRLLKTYRGLLTSEQNYRSGTGSIYCRKLSEISEGEN